MRVSQFLNQLKVGAALFLSLFTLAVPFFARAADYNERWHINLGDTADNPTTGWFAMTSLIANGDGTVFFTGPFRAPTFVFSVGGQTAGSTDSILAKVGSHGELVWMRTIGGADRDTIWGSALDSDGNVLIVGDSLDLDSLMGGVQPEVPSPGGFLIKYDTNGNVLWKQYVMDWLLGSVAVDGDNNVYATGGVNVSDQTGHVMKFDKLGGLLWKSTYSGVIGLGAMLCSASGKVFVTTTKDTQPISFNVAEIDSDGALLSIQPLPVNNWNHFEGLEIIADAAGEALVRHSRFTADAKRILDPLGQKVWQAAEDNAGNLFVATGDPTMGEFLPGITLSKYSVLSNKVAYSRNKGSLVLRWDKELGKTLETTSSLDSNQWTPMKGIFESDGSMIFTNALNLGNMGFFRVRN